MNREPFDESLLTAYLDDELSHDDRNKVESALRESPQLTKLLEQLRIVRKLVTSAVRSEENKLAGADATTLADAGQPSFTIKGPWQSAAVTKPTDTSPAMVATKRVDPVVAATHDQAFHRALRGWMMLASLAATLSNKVSEKLEDSDSFPIVWLQFLKAIQSTLIERFEDLKNSIKLRLPSQYPGENLEQLAAQFCKDARELTTAGQNNHNLTLLR